MYVVCSGYVYRRIRNLKFFPEVDITGSTCPVNYFTVDIQTSRELSLYTQMQLYDEEDTVWASYYITGREKVDDGFVRITASSILSKMDEVYVSGGLYNDVPIATALSGILGSLSYTLDEGLTDKVINGYLASIPIRDALHQITFSIGAYVRDFFNSGRVNIAPLGDLTKIIQYDKTFWKPEATESTYYKTAEVTSYTYERILREPTSVEEYVEVNGSYYVVTKTVHSRSNPTQIYLAPASKITLDGTTLVNEDNYADTYSLVDNLFKEVVTADCINEGEYLPGDKVYLYLRPMHIITGYIQKADFKFGTKTRSTLTIIGCETVATSGALVMYVWHGLGTVIEMEHLNTGSQEYTYTTHYIDKTVDNHRYIFRPIQSSVHIPALDYIPIIEISCEVALDFYDNILYIYSVDEVSGTTRDSEVVAVIDESRQDDGQAEEESI